MYVVVSYDKILFCPNSKIVKLNLILFQKLLLCFWKEKLLMKLKIG